MSALLKKSMVRGSFAVFTLEEVLGSFDETNQVRTATSNRANVDQEWNQVVEVLRNHYFEPDLLAARVLYSAVAAHQLKGQPVWPMAVAPPGSMKSELITALQDVPDVYLVDAVTSKTFLSGQIPDDRAASNRSASLLHRIGKSGVILIPDFSTVLSMKSEERASVFADLRKIFDGKLTKEFGTAEKVEGWEGRITVVVGATPEIDRQRAAIQTLGERFVIVRWNRAGLDAARVAIDQDREGAHADLRKAVSGLLTQLPDSDVEILSDWKERIVALAEIAVKARTHVPREGQSRELAGDPVPESATRLAQQLCQLAKGSALLSRRAQVTREDFDVVERAGFDSIPPRRARILQALASGKEPAMKTTTDRLDVEDLHALGLVESAHRLNEETAVLFKAVRGETGRTIPPPSSNKKTNGGVGGSVRVNAQEAASGL